MPARNEARLRPLSIQCARLEDATLFEVEHGRARDALRARRRWKHAVTRSSPGRTGPSVRNASKAIQRRHTPGRSSTATCRAGPRPLGGELREARSSRRRAGARSALSALWCFSMRGTYFGRG
eukprot:8575370-Alexandrium_andersonii.AAC.1